MSNPLQQYRASSLENTPVASSVNNYNWASQTHKSIYKKKQYVEVNHMPLPECWQRRRQECFLEKKHSYYLKMTINGAIIQKDSTHKSKHGM